MVDKKDILERLNIRDYYNGQWPGFKPAGGDEIKNLCPFHEDTNPSFYVNIKKGTYFCQGCSERGDVFTLYQRLHNVDFQTAVADMAKMVGLSNGGGHKEHGKKKREQARAVMENKTASYDYYDENDQYVFTVMRFEEEGRDKTFRQWRYDFEKEDWIQNVQGVTLIPYRLAEVVRADTVYIVEGEKDAENLASIGLTATTAPQGAGKWKPEYNQYFKGKHVVVFPDNDEVGRKHADDVKKSLLPHVAGIRVVELPGLPPKGDASDFLAAGGTVDQLLQIVEQEPEERPPFSFATLDVEALRAGRYIETKPEKIRWTLTDSLPQGSLGFIISNGGVGKSWFLLQAAMSVATHLDCLDGIFEIGERGRAFCLFGEDVEPVVHARTKSVFDTYFMNPREGIYHDPTSRDTRIAELQDRLFLLPGSGKDLRLIREDGGNLAPTQTYLDLLALLKSIEDLKLVILDPVSRFYAGSENDNVQATYFCSLLERISSETGATVIISHHTNKAATNPNESSYNALFQGAIRGASGFTNAARWQLNLTTLKSKEVREAGGNPTRYFNYIAGKVVKKNVGKPETRFWLERTDGGVLRRFDSKLDEDGLDGEVKEQVIDRIAELENEGHRVTKISFAQDYSGEIGVSKRKLTTVIEELLAEGLLTVKPEKNERGRVTDYISSIKEDKFFQ